MERRRAAYRGRRSPRKDWFWYLGCLMSDGGWLDHLKQIFDESFQVDWESHLASLNERLGLGPESRFAVSIPGLPPFWFNGDVEGLADAPWTLVISLNHQMGTYQDPPTEEGYWEFCRLHNQKHWYAGFFRPVVRVAVTCLGETVTADEEPEFASRRMVFVELCPYASRRFSLPTPVVEELVGSESGFLIAAQITAILLAEARPDLLLVNGASALASFRALYRPRLAEWDRRAYASASSGRKLWHEQGILRRSAHDLPVIGFPFLRKPQTHNSYVEIDQLGTAGGEFVRSVSQSSEP